MRYLILSRRNLTYKIGNATHKKLLSVTLHTSEIAYPGNTDRSCTKSQKTKSRTDEIPNGQNPELDKIPNGQNPELDKIPNGQNPELDKIPNGKNPEFNQLQR